MLRVGKPPIKLSEYTNQDSDGSAMLVAHAYKAVSAGKVSVRVALGVDASSANAYVGLTSDPAGAGDMIQQASISSATAKVNFYFDVAKNEYFEITVAGGATIEAIFWKSIGTLRKPVDYN